MSTALDSTFLLERAAKCRRLAESLSECETAAKLRELAVEYESQAGIGDLAGAALKRAPWVPIPG